MHGYVKMNPNITYNYNAPKNHKMYISSILKFHILKIWGFRTLTCKWDGILFLPSGFLNNKTKPMFLVGGQQTIACSPNLAHQLFFVNTLYQNTVTFIWMNYGCFHISGRVVYLQLTVWFINSVPLQCLLTSNTDWKYHIIG